MDCFLIISTFILGNTYLFFVYWLQNTHRQLRGNSAVLVKFVSQYMYMSQCQNTLPLSAHEYRLHHHLSIFISLILKSVEL